MKHFIGIAGISDLSDAGAVAMVCQGLSQGVAEPDHGPMIGYQVSLQTLLGQPVKNIRFPPLESLTALLKITSPSAHGCLHYRTSAPEELAEQVTRLLQESEIYERGYARAVQLNVRWPSPQAWR